VLDLLREDTPQLYALCGRGPQSTLRILRHGLALSELAVSDLPGVPHAVWTTKKVRPPTHTHLPGCIGRCEARGGRGLGGDQPFGLRRLGHL